MLLVQLLLDGGYPRAAAVELAKLEPEARGELEIMLLLVRTKLMLQDMDGAREWTALMTDNPAAPVEPQTFARLGGIYEAARNPEMSASIYEKALAAGHVPEAHLGLGRLAAARREKDLARKHYLDALDTAKPLPEGAVGPLPLFQQILGLLVSLEDPVLNCAAWIVEFDPEAQPKALSKHSLLVYARTLSDAQQYMAVIIQAMQPDTPPAAENFTDWTKASKVQQPDGPCRPGVQSVLS